MVAMTPLAADLLVLFRRDLRCFIREVEAFPDDATLWRTVPGLRNSVGNLALHVAGNLRLLVGAALGGTGFQRDREQELNQRTGTRTEVAAALEAAAHEVERGLNAVTEKSLATPFPLAVGGLQPNTQRFLVHLAAHLAFHLGQAGYLRRTLTGEATVAGAMAIKELLP
jgi:uncharacterized damage-inducible protein DinB